APPPAFVKTTLERAVLSSSVLPGETSKSGATCSTHALKRAASSAAPPNRARTWPCLDRTAWRCVLDAVPIPLVTTKCNQHDRDAPRHVGPLVSSSQPRSTVRFGPRRSAGVGDSHVRPDNRQPAAAR